jgi:hypothetical protein
MLIEKGIFRRTPSISLIGTDHALMIWETARPHLLSHVFSTLAFTLIFLPPTKLTAPAKAQPEPERYEDVTWNHVQLIDYKAGKESRAMEIVGDHLISAYEEAHVPAPRVVELQTGPWDVMLVRTMKEGPSEMIWKTSPEEVKLLWAHRKMYGEMKADSISAEHEKLITRSTSYVGFSGRYGPPITPVTREEGSGEEPQSELQFTGTIQYLEIEGGAWVIERTGGTTYEPEKLPKEYQKEGLKVRVWANRLEDGLCPIGCVIELAG